MMKTVFNSSVKLIVAVSLGLFLLQPVLLYAETHPMSQKEREAYEALSPFEFKNILIETDTTLNDDDYTAIGKNIREVMDDFFQNWKRR